jgi:hypothetical protein
MKKNLSEALESQNAKENRPKKASTEDNFPEYLISNDGQSPASECESVLTDATSLNPNAPLIEHDGGDPKIAQPVWRLSQWQDVRGGHFSDIVEDVNLSNHSPRIN